MLAASLRYRSLELGRMTALWKSLCWILGADLINALHLGGQSEKEFRRTDLHPWKSNYTPDLSSTKLDFVSSYAGRNFSADVYFIRHGQSVLNLKQEEHGHLEIRTDADADAALTKVGIVQAMKVQKLLAETLGLKHVPPEALQLASSLNIRAFDTLVIATQSLWNASNGSGFRLHEVPALMEIDSSVYSGRRFGVATEDDPVRWMDSALASNTTRLAEVAASTFKLLGINRTAARKLFYRDSSDADPNGVTMKHAEVKSGFPRNTTDCSAQLGSLKLYLAEAALRNKTHMVLGTHGGVVGCAFQLDYAMPNAAVLHARLDVSADSVAPNKFTVNLTALQMHDNPIVSY
eukprot:TRINITY_DN42778_c0_g1_i1.p1 TRINITY_DN42778_c0_g1~~TRINITY_DN42778_c0_g1_i1.p1  ORF type:complete len:349 (+),score=78.06 TRINITY_DN42778_c0_g1_i1:108-1154(+)